MLTKIGDEKIEGITSEYEEILELSPDPVRFYITDALLEAQLEADQEKVPEIEKRAIDTAITAYESTCEALISQALKDVGEWLENFVKEGGIVPHILLEALKRGEMPKND